MQAARQAKKLADYQAPDFLITHIELEFELDPLATRVTANSRVIRQGAHQNPLKLDGQQLQLVGVWIDGHPCTDYVVSDCQLILSNVPDSFSLRIETFISPQTNTALEGLYLSNGAYCTQCEAEGFRAITYYCDRPDVLAVFTTHIIADQQQYPHVLSNGNLMATQPMADGRTRVTWHDPYPKPCYLFALVAGAFDKLEDSYTTSSGRVVQLAFYVDPGQVDRAHFAMAALKRAMRFDEQTYGLEYDLDIYMVVAVDFFNMGAMENKGLNIFNSKFVLASDQTATDHDYYLIESIIGHEYFHNWTGNRVTCRDWFQLSLKEGLTVFRDQQFSAAMASPTLVRLDAIQTIRTLQFAEDASPMAHPIRPEQVLEMNNFYTVTVYDKGAEVIRMQHTLLGDAAFGRGLSLFLSRHDGQAVTCDDFVQAMQDASGIDLQQFKRWYAKAGTPQVSIQTDYCPQRQQLRLQFTQRIPQPSAAQADAAVSDTDTSDALVIPLRMEFISADRSYHQQRLITLTQLNQTEIIEQVPAAVKIVTLADFSAPIKVNYSQSDDDLLFIARYAQDGVARWDALQTLWLQVIVDAVNAYAQDKLTQFAIPSSLLAMMKELLQQPLADRAFCAELLTLPSFDSLVEDFSTIPVDALLAALQQLRLVIATELATDLVACYQNFTARSYQYNSDAVGQRRLQALCLSYLAFLPEQQPLLTAHYHAADNMTDRLNALQALVMAASLQSSSQIDALLQQLHTDFAKDVLVFDKWASLQASWPTDDVFTRLEQVIACPQFSWQNPNRVRAVYGAFSRLNPSQFHRRDGKGYELLCQIILKLDAINPQLAARLVTPLLSWQRYDAVRQPLLKQQLEAILSHASLSNDLFEKVSASLPSQS